MDFHPRDAERMADELPELWGSNVAHDVADLLRAAVTQYEHDERTKKAMREVIGSLGEDLAIEYSKIEYLEEQLAKKHVVATRVLRDEVVQGLEKRFQRMEKVIEAVRLYLKMDGADDYNAVVQALKEYDDLQK